MSEEMVDKMSELISGEHGALLTAWGYECARAAKLGWIEGSVLVTAVVVSVAGGVYLGNKLAKAHKKMRIEKLKKNVVEAK
jgi:hypothetical protein